MGIFYLTNICYGFRSEKNKYNIPNTQKISDIVGEFIIMNNSLIKLKAIDPVIDDNDMALGHVPTTEINRCLKIESSFFKLSTEEFNKVCVENGVDGCDIGWFIVEYVWTSYESDNKDLFFRKKLPCVIDS